jgi:hypothetical protein
MKVDIFDSRVVVFLVDNPYSDGDLEALKDYCNENCVDEIKTTKKELKKLEKVYKKFSDLREKMSNRVADAEPYDRDGV